MAKAIMIQGTMSNVGKSWLTAGLCRIFKQDGYRVAPFKAQNMALNSYITKEGLEMGRAQVVQAEACGIEPSVLMNPILLKPVTDLGSQVIVHGQVRGTMQAMEYYQYKRQLLPEVHSAYAKLAAQVDIVVIEGAGSPAEINLKQDDIVNMNMAKMAGAPVLLVGDIDRGGVFAQLLGTLQLLEPEEQAMVKGLVINKFRGDSAILQPGLAQISQRTGKPVVGVIPYLQVDLDDEDSLTSRFQDSCQQRKRSALVDVAVVQLPRISNFTDFRSLEAEPELGLRYVRHPAQLGRPDMIILPGSKHTMADLRWLRQCGLEAAILRQVAAGTILFGICGGYQMLGESIIDAVGAEGGGQMAGMGLLPMTTEFGTKKRRLQTTGRLLEVEGALKPLSGCDVEGYEIHMGRTVQRGTPFLQFAGGQLDGGQKGNVYGCYLHGFFDSAACRTALRQALLQQKGIVADGVSFSLEEYKEVQYNQLADAIRQSLHLPQIYDLLEAGV